MIIATKFFGPMGEGPKARGTSRSHMLYSLEGSLKRLQVDHIDLYQIHGFDKITPIEETLRALDTVIQQGKVRYIGVSNWAAWQIAKAVGISNQFNLARFASGTLHDRRTRPGTRTGADNGIGRHRTDGVGSAGGPPSVR